MAHITSRALTPGTREWAECTPPFLSRAVQIILRELEQIPQLARDLQERRIWETAPGETSNWDDFCRNVMLVDPVFVDVLVKLARTAVPSSAVTALPVDVDGEPALPDTGAANDDGATSVEDAEALAFDFTSLVDFGTSTTSPPRPSPSSASSRGILVDPALVEEWIVLSVQKVRRGAATTATPGDRERPLQTLARIREVAAAAGIDLAHVEVDEDGRLVTIPPADDDGEASLGWGLAMAEREIRGGIERDARQPAKPKPTRSSAGRTRRKAGRLEGPPR